MRFFLVALLFYSVFGVNGCGRFGFGDFADPSEDASVDSDSHSQSETDSETGNGHPEIVVTQATTTVSSGTGSFDFGPVHISESSPFTTFTIENNGSDTLHLTGSPHIQITGSDRAEFVVETQPTSPVPAGERTDFTLVFSPQSSGLKSATISIENNDRVRDPYTFSVNGTGELYPLQEIQVFQESTEIIHDETELDLGETESGSSSETFTFTIRNIGSHDLILTGEPLVKISGLDATVFTIDSEPTSPISPEGSTTFDLTFSPVTASRERLDVTIETNDSDENPFRFSVAGTGVSTHGPDIAPCETTSAFQTARFAHQSVVSGGFIYIFGGEIAGAEVLDSVQFAEIRPDGSLSDWTETTPFETARARHTAASYNGYVYISGGFFDGIHYDDVQFAPLQPDGTIAPGTWSFAESLPSTRRAHRMVAYNGNLYAVGGRNGDGDTLGEVLRGTIDPDTGAVREWTPVESLNSARMSFGLVASNGFLYAIGGYIAGAPMRTVEYTAIGPDGSLAPWQETTPLPEGRERSGTEAVQHNGYLYIVGGDSELEKPTFYYNDADYTQIQEDGSVGSWSTVSYTFSPSRTSGTTEVYNDHLYVLGGWDEATIFYNVVQYSLFAL